MNSEEEAALIVAGLPGVDPRLMRTIHSQGSSFAAFLDQSPASCPAHLAEPLSAWHRDPDPFRRKAAGQAAGLRRAGIRLLPVSVSDYPALLREIHRPPPVLYVRGDVSALALPQLAIVGSRRASRRGLDCARRFASALAEAGFAITSGLALGIDGAAHAGALEAGKTLAVLGCGLDVVYPRQHRRLYQQIPEGGGALVSEFPPGTPARAAHFPQRNRIISGLALGTLVVEAAPRSGSLITARLAMEQGREVFAVPGSIQDPHARGCHQLIREGATLVETVQDVAEQLGGMLSYKVEEAGPDAATENAAPDGEAGRVLDAMGFEPADLDTLVRATGLDAANLTGLLVDLELSGYVESVAGRYTRLR